MLKDNYQLSMAKSGTQALEFLKKARPDLILLDVRMPGMDGYETLEHIKSNTETSNIPVVFLTVDDQRESEIKGLKIDTIGNLKPTEMTIINSTTDLLTLVIDWQGFTYNNNVVKAIDIVNKKVLNLTMTNDTNDDSFVSYFNDEATYTFTIEYTKYKTLNLS